MRISRLRLRLVASFGIALAAALVVLCVALFAFLRREAEEVFTESLVRSARGIARGVEWEAQEHPDVDLAGHAQEAVDEWPPGDEILAIFRPDGSLLATRGGDRLDRKHLPMPTSEEPTGATTLRLADGEWVRLVVLAELPEAPYRVLVARSTRDLRTDAEELVEWLVVSVPLVALLALVGGYVLASGALAPVRALASAVDGIDTHALKTRLPVGSPPDEIDALAARFNELLDRLSSARQQVREFLADAAHQIKTPLTVVRGESALALDRPREADEYREALQRVQRAAHQMAHRVDDLFLLARAEAGEKPSLDDVVELDGLALEVTDLMRGRAAREGRKLELDRVEAVETHGNEVLLREGLTELLENAVRYGSAGAPIRVSAYLDGGRAVLAVSSEGPHSGATSSPEKQASDTVSTGLGLSIVRWIAEAHDGSLEHRHHESRNTYRLHWPHRPLSAPVA